MADKVIAISQVAGIESQTRRSFIGFAAMAGLAFWSSGAECHAALKLAEFEGGDMSESDSAFRGRPRRNTRLKWDVFVTPGIRVVTSDFAPGEYERPWPPIASTLIYGSRDAVVVDSLSVWSRPGLRPTGLPPQEETSQLFMQLTGTAITSSGRAFFWNASQKRTLSPRPARFKS